MLKYDFVFFLILANRTLMSLRKSLAKTYAVEISNTTTLKKEKEFNERVQSEIFGVNKCLNFLQSHVHY